MPCIKSGMALLAQVGKTRSMRFPHWVFGVTVLVACGGASSSKPAAGGGSGGSTSSAGSSEGSAGEGGGGEKAEGGGEKTEGAAVGPAAKADPIDAALPDTAATKPFARRHECPKGGCNLKLVVPEALRPKADDKAPIVMWETVMPPKTMLLFPRHEGLDVYGFLLDGEISLMADDIKGKQLRVWKNGGFRAPGVGANAFSKEPTRIVFAAVVNGKDGTVAKAIEQLEKKEKVAWSKRPAPVMGFEPAQKPDLAWGSGAYHARLGVEGSSEGAPPASLGLLLMSKNAPVAQHTHDKEWEFLAILDGAGTLAKKDGDVPVNGATFAAVPPGTPHAFKPGGSTPTFAIQMYWPPGPEQRFKKLAEEGK